MMASALPAADAAMPTPLTRVALAYVEQHLDLYLRFGEPLRIIRLNPWQRWAVFPPGALLCRIRWQANAYGTILWQLMVIRTCARQELSQIIHGVQPSARLLLHAKGEPSVRAVLERIDAIEALGIVPADTPPTYWQTLGNRLAARLPLPEYSAERHAAWLARRGLS